MDTSENRTAVAWERRPWEPPTVKSVGTIGEIVRQGGGKVSILSGDPGEPRKVPSTG
jgi:hypothetical protein